MINVTERWKSRTMDQKTARMGREAKEIAERERDTEEEGRKRSKANRTRRERELQQHGWKQREQLTQLVNGGNRNRQDTWRQTTHNNTNEHTYTMKNNTRLQQTLQPLSTTPTPTPRDQGYEEAVYDVPCNQPQSSCGLGAAV